MNLFYIAFQNTTTPSNSPYTWNNLQTIATTLITGLKDSTGASTSYNMTLDGVSGVTKNSNGLNVVGSGAASWVNQAAITQETFTFAFNRTMTFTGLNNSRTYNVKVFGSQNGAGTNNIDITIAGTNQVLNISNNSTQILTWSGIAPSSGNIAMTLTKQTGSFRISAILLEELNASVTSIDSTIYPGNSFSYTTSGFGTLSTITTDKPDTTVSSVGATSATLSNFVVGGVYPTLPTTVSLTFGDGTNSASTSTTIGVPTAYTKVSVVDAVWNNTTYIAGAIYATDGRILQTLDTIYHATVSTLVVAANTGITISKTVVDAAGGSLSFAVWVRIGSGTDVGKMYNYTITVQSADLSGKLITDKITSRSITGGKITTVG